jgi:hypothetical protein
MATLTVVDITRAGVDVAGVAPPPVTGDEWANTGRELLLVKNGSGAPINVTLDLKGTIDGLAITDKVVRGRRRRDEGDRPVPPGLYNDDHRPREGDLLGDAVVTVKVLRLPAA